MEGVCMHKYNMYIHTHINVQGGNWKVSVSSFTKYCKRLKIPLTQMDIAYAFKDKMAGNGFIDVQAFVQVHACMHTYIYIHTYIHACMHAWI